MLTRRPEVSSRARSFDATFDDVYQLASYARTVSVEAPVRSTDLAVSLALGALLHEKVLVPARMLIDHLPFHDVLNAPGWSPVVAALVQPVAVERDWDTFLAECGGTGRRGPLRMSSYEDRNAVVREAWERAGPRESREVFNAQFPHAAEFVDMMKRLGIGLAPYSDPTASYGPYLEKRLSATRLPRRLIERFTRAESRSDALKILSELRRDRRLEEKEYIVDRLATAINAAKHAEVCCALGVEEATFVGQRVDHGRRGVIARAEEVPMLGSVLQGALAGEEVRALLDSLELADRARECRRASSPDVVLHNLRCLCAGAAATLGRSRGRANSLTASQLGQTSLALGLAGTSALFEMGAPVQLALVVAGGMLLFSGARSEGSPSWARLHASPRLYGELVAVAGRRINAGHLKVFDDCD